MLDFNESPFTAKAWGQVEVLEKTSDGKTLGEIRREAWEKLFLGGSVMSCKHHVIFVLCGYKPMPLLPINLK